jgi:aryl-alcohol dehydrogenase-like predicted oxidoreductase
VAPERRSLGKGGIEISVVGFGSWAVGGGGVASGWGSQSDADSIAAIRHAVDLGVDWIDTAPVYGFGHSEEVVGRALAAVPASARPRVFTKCGLAWNPDQPLTDPWRHSEPTSLRRELEASLRRLGVEAIDLLQVHAPDARTSFEDSWGQMARFVDEGLVRAIGVSNYDVEQLERCERIRHVDSLQPPFSLLDREAATALIPWAHAHEVGVIGYSPLGSGVLTGSFSAERVAAMDADDWRASAPRFREPGLSAGIALRDALRPIASRHEVTVEAVAVAWTLAWPGVSGAIVGARRPSQVDTWLAGGNLRLVDEDLAEIEAAISAAGAGRGPARPRRIEAATGVAESDGTGPG